VVDKSITGPHVAVVKEGFVHLCRVDGNTVTPNSCEMGFQWQLYRTFNLW